MFHLSDTEGTSLTHTIAKDLQIKTYPYPNTFYGQYFLKNYKNNLKC